METSQADGFAEYRRLILDALERLDRSSTALDIKLDLKIELLLAKLEALRLTDIADIKVDIAMLKVKASLLGAVCGLAAAAVMHYALR